jgi:hypothetical protein
MSTILFDIETNGFMDREDLRAHCAVAVDIDTEEWYMYRPGEMEEFADWIQKADRLVGHNIAGFDLPVLERLYPGFKFSGEIWDTLFASRLIFISNLFERSIALQRSSGKHRRVQEARMPSRLLNSHSLEAWGYRLNTRKSTDFSSAENAFEIYTPEMLAYCRQDVETNLELYHYLKKEPANYGWDVCSDRSIMVDSKCGYLLARQERNGVGFNVEAAEALYLELLAERTSLTKTLREFFPPWFRPEANQKGEHSAVNDVVEEERRLAAAEGRMPVDFSRFSVPARTMIQKPTEDRPWPVTRVEGAPFAKTILTDFNPASDKHIGERLQAVYGWEPTETTDLGAVKVDEETLSDLDYPPIPALCRIIMINKRIGQIAEGKQAWLKQVKDDKIHGRVHVTGTRTSRMAHFGPNLAQVPKVGKPFGAECRALFGPTRPGWVQVGADASGIELRMLANRMSFWDEGAFGLTLLDGDPHSDWMKLTKILIRDNQKTFTYALLYGAGDVKLGTIIIKDWRQAFEQGVTSEKAPHLRFAKDLGAKSRGSLLQGLPALDLLLKACKAAFKQGWLTGLDGRVLKVKSEHGALNDLLQGDGATVMKHGLINLDLDLAGQGIVHGVDYAHLLNVHDEWQIECKPAFADEIGETMVRAMEQAGLDLEVRIPLTGTYKVGANWSETH